MNERVCCYNGINRDIKTIHQQKYRQDPKIILTNRIAHKYQQYLSHIRARLARDSQIHSGTKDEATDLVQFISSDEIIQTT